MSQFVKDFTNENKPTFDRYSSFIKDNDWIEEKTKKEKESGFGIEKGLIESILERLEYFVKKAEGDMHLKSAQAIIDVMRKPINVHLSRILKYTEKEDITAYTDKNKIKEEIDFQDTLFGVRNKVKDRLGKLPIDDNFTESLVVFHDKQLASLPMKEVVETSFFKVKNKVEALNVDWNVNTSKELYINMKPKDIPPYNPNKHYWEQDTDVLQFWAEEFNKIKDGININGYHLHPFLYFHLNFFKTRIPQPDGKDKIMSPPLRDNEWYYVENYEEARIKKKILAITGSRRYSKSTIVSSQTQWRALTINKAECLVAGGSAKDLGQIEKNLKLSFNNIDEAFRVPLIKKDWTSKAILGLKSAMHTPYEQSTIHIINLDKGGNMSTELLAGYTPDNFVLDEYLKFSFLDALEALKPALQSPYGWRCVPQLLGTGGNETLSQDALKMLSNPEAYDILPMNWDRLNNMCDPDEMTWKNGKFGTFVPAQMSVKDGIVKIPTDLQTYLKSDNKGLSKIKIEVTDWTQANKVINEDRDRKSNQPDAIRKEKIYYPIDTEEIFLSGKTNPFPAMKAKKHKDHLISTGNVGKAVDLYRDSSGKVCYAESNKEYPLFPYPGGFHDSPVTIYEDPPENPDTESNLFISSLDDYKHESSDGDSLGSMVIFKRIYTMGEWDDRIVASYHSRPDPHNDFHKNCWMLLELYGAKCFPENEDMEFKIFLDKKFLTEKYLVKGFSMLQDFGLNANGNRDYGWQPTTKNKRALFGQLVKYTKDDTDIKDEKGDILKIVEGIQKVPDIKILDEMINYKEGGNFDGITAFMGVLGYAHWLDMNYMSPDVKDKRRDEKPKKTVDRKLSMFTKKRYGMFK